MNDQRKYRRRTIMEREEITISTITRDQLKRKMESGDEFKLVETLPEADFKKQHLPGAINLPVERIRELDPHDLPNKQENIVVYCADPSCHASDIAARDLAVRGYSNVQRYVGGKRDWIDAGLATEGTSQTVKMGV
jgi:rhodanese-related sulfurtransferase